LWAMAKIAFFFDPVLRRSRAKEARQGEFFKRTTMWGDLYEHGAKPAVALAGWRVALLAGALVVARRETGPGCEPLGRCKDAHVRAHLRDDRGSGDMVDGRDLPQQLPHPRGGRRATDRSWRPAGGRCPPLCARAVRSVASAAQRLVELMSPASARASSSRLLRRLPTARSAIAEGDWDALGEGHDNRSTRLTEDVRHDPRELEACSFQQFDDPVLAGRLLADSLLSVSGEDPQVLLSFVRQEARTHQTVHHELR
jgi:hypothetical protein